MVKIKTKYYLNKRLKPKIIDYQEHYPVYYRFNLEGSNHQIKSQLIDYLKDESELSNFEKEIEKEALYLNTLINNFKGNYRFFNFVSHFEFLNMDIYNLFNSFYLQWGTSERINVEGDEIHYLFSHNYHDELANYLSSKTNFCNVFFHKVLKDHLVNLNIELPIYFLKNEKLKNEVEIHNSLLLLINEGKINLHDYFFNDKRIVVKSILTTAQFKLFDEFMDGFYKEIFEEKFLE